MERAQVATASLPRNERVLFLILTLSALDDKEAQAVDKGLRLLESAKDVPERNRIIAQIRAALSKPHSV
jgi:hypothetical protein